MRAKSLPSDENGNENRDEETPVADPLAFDMAERREERILLRHGKLLQVTSEQEHDRVVLIGKSGRIELTLEITESGAKVVVDAADLAIRAKNKVAVECDTFEVAARQIVAKATQSASIEAPDASLHATEGDLSLRANDDVKINGERVLLNSDGDLRVPEWMKKDLGAKPGHDRSEVKSEVKVEAADVSGDESLLSEFESIESNRQKG